MTGFRRHIKIVSASEEVFCLSDLHGGQNFVVVVLSARIVAWLFHSSPGKKSSTCAHTHTRIMVLLFHILGKEKGVQRNDKVTLSDRQHFVCALIDELVVKHHFRFIIIGVVQPSSWLR